MYCCQYIQTQRLENIVLLCPDIGLKARQKELLNIYESWQQEEKERREMFIQALAGIRLGSSRAAVQCANHYTMPQPSFSE